MARPRDTFFPSLATLVAAVALAAPLAGQPAAPRSDRNANYTIEVALDPETKTLTGNQVLEWRNIQDGAADELRFHLYWNAWSNRQSTWMLEDRFRGRSDLGDDIDPGDWSYLVVDGIRLLGEAGETVELTDAYHASPDDGNPDDRTVLVVPLPAAVEPGQTVRVEMDWRAKVPRTFARTGFRGDFYFIAHWFPKLGVWEGDGWNCHQFHAATEFYSDYGVYDVTVTVPANYVLGASGRRVESRDNDDGTITHRHREEDIHAFTWTASPDYQVLQERFEEPGLPAVDIRLLIQPEHLKQAPRHFQATKAALKLYGEWYGPYPYGHVTVVDPAFGSGAGGMEYPTIFTCGTRWHNPFGGGSPEGVTIHEAGHQFWYAIVGNNEFEDAWIDEGLNTFSTGRAYSEAFGDQLYSKRYFSPPGTDLSGFFRVNFDDMPRSWSVPSRRLDRYRRSATADVEATPTWRYFPRTAGDISYSKTAVWLVTLEYYLGWETLRGILSTFFDRFKFRHPKPDDFLAIADEVAGEDLSWFFDQVFRDDATFDYAVASVESERIPTEGFRQEGGTLSFRPLAEDEEGPYRTEVVVRREGTGVFPVEVLMVFEDGSEVRESWDGANRWKLFVHAGDSRLDYAVVDPDRILMLDLDYTNNSLRLRSDNRLPVTKWAAKWLFWLQDLLLAFGSFV